MAQEHIAMSTGNIPEAGHLFTQDTLEGTNGVHIIDRGPFTCDP